MMTPLSHPPGPTRVGVGFVDAGFLRELARWPGGPSSDQLRVRPQVNSTLASTIPYASTTSWLRTYVYDGELPSDHDRAQVQDEDFRLLRSSPGINLRLGKAVVRGGVLQQKGVDALLVLDMLEMAHRDA